MVRILHVINGELYAGAERVQDLLALRLGQFGYEVGFACIKPGLFPSQRQAQRAPLHMLPMRSRFDLGQAFRLASIIRKEGYAMVHTHTPRSAMLGRLAALLAGVPMVHHVHSPTARDSEHGLRNQINQSIERFSLIGVSRMIAVSRSLGSYLRAEGFPERRIRVVFNGVPTPASPTARSTPRPPWTIGTVALFRPRKGLEVLLHAVADLSAKGRALRLRAVGPFVSPEYEDSIHKLVGQLGIAHLIDWVGFSADIGGEFGRMDAFVLPSLYGEGMPMVVLEAMAHGVPVVSTRVEGIPEVIADGQSGLLVGANDAPEVAHALARLFDGDIDWQAMRTVALDTQRRSFSDLSMADGVAKVYDELLDVARSGAT